MNEFIKTFLNARSLRAATKELSIEQLDEVLIKLSKIIADRKEDETIELAKQQEKQDKVNAILAQLKESGISPEELLTLTETEQVKTKTKREPRPAKYAYEHEGESKTWTGQGRMPLPLQTIMNEKGSIEEFLI